MTTPEVVHWKTQPYDVYIGRPGPWGNPFSSKAGVAQHRVSSKSEAIRKHREWVLGNADLQERIRQELRGKVLG